MDHKREHRTPPLARVMGVGSQQQPYGNGGRMPKIRNQLGLGNFCTKADVLAVLHLKYPWVKVQRRLTRTGNALLVSKDNRSQKLLMEVKSINGKECSFQPAETTFRKIYIMMGVPSCITEELLLQDEEVLEASGMTKWMKTQTTTPTDIMKVVLSGKQHPPDLQGDTEVTG